jgi:hypothetical protein
MLAWLRKSTTEKRHLALAFAHNCKLKLELPAAKLLLRLGQCVGAAPAAGELRIHLGPTFATATGFLLQNKL